MKFGIYSCYLQYLKILRSSKLKNCTAFENQAQLTSFFLSTIISWNVLNTNLGNSSSLVMSKTNVSLNLTDNLTDKLLLN